MSMNRWGYVEGNPTNLTDPTGHFPEWCRSKWTKWGYAKCVLDFYNLEAAGSIFFNGDAVKDVKGSSGCWSGPIQYRGHGYIEGYSWFGTVYWGGEETVYDFARMESSKFTYNGFGINDSVLGGGYALYAGYAEGLRSDGDLQNHYKGKAFVETRGFDIPIIADEISLGLGGTLSTSVSDWKLKTYTAYVSGGGSLGLPLVDIGYGVVDYIPLGVSRHYGKSGEFASMITDMVSGKYSPYPQSIQPPSALYSIRGYFAVLAAKYSVVYMEMNNERTRSENLSK